MTIVFSGVTLQYPTEPEQDFSIIVNKTRLLSGKLKVQGSTETAPTFKFKCHTTDQAHIETIISLIGTAGTLEIDGVHHTNCYIDSFKKIWEGNDNWTYEISFVRDTT